MSFTKKCWVHQSVIKLLQNFIADNVLGSLKFSFLSLSLDSASQVGLEGSDWSWQTGWLSVAARI